METYSGGSNKNFLKKRKKKKKRTSAFKNKTGSFS